MIYYCIVLGIEPSEEPSMAWRNMEHVTTNDKGQEISRKPFALQMFAGKGSGYPLKSYRPTIQDTMQQLVRWTFEGVTKQDSPAVVGAMRARAPDNKRDKTMSPWPVDHVLGSTSRTWPSMPPCRQKLIDFKMFDPHGQYFKRGGHMPLMVFFGAITSNVGQRATAKDGH